MSEMSDESRVMNAIIRGEPVPAPTVKVYVRLGDDENERTIAFRVPNEMDPMDLLERGATIDGNQAMLTVAWDPNVEVSENVPAGAYTCPDLNDQTDWKGNPAPFQEFEGKSLTRVLGDCQRGLVRFFRERGYTVQFA